MTRRIFDISFLLIVLVQTVGLAIAAEPASPSEMPATVLEAVALRDAPEVAPTVSRIVAASADTFLILEERPARLLRMVVGQEPEIVLGTGPGPMELDSPLWLLSRPTGRPGVSARSPILLHAINRLTTIEYSQGATVRRIRHDRILTSVVARKNGYLASLYTSADAASGARLGGIDRLGRFRIAEGDHGESWKLKWSRRSFDYSADFELDFARSYYSRLLPRDSASCYFVELIGAPDVLIIDDEAHEIGRFSVPRGGYRAQAAQSDSSLRDHLVSKDALVDSSGRLHLLRGLYARADGSLEQSKEILVFEPAGLVVDHLRTGVQLDCFDLTPDEQSYVGVEAGTGRILRFPLPESSR